MSHWFVRWLVFTYLVQLVAQIVAIQAALWIFGLSVDGWLGTHRPIVAFVLVVHFVCYLLTMLTSVDRDRLDEISKSRLSDE